MEAQALPLPALPPLCDEAGELDALDHMLLSNDGTLGDLEELLTLVWGTDAGGLRDALPPLGAAAYEPAAAAPEAVTALRCLDATHGADCTRRARWPTRAPRCLDASAGTTCVCDRARARGCGARGARRAARASTRARACGLAGARRAARRTRLT
jgi:hypothetical protein